MNYEEAVAYIDETPKFTKKNSLDHTKECLRRLGNPQDKFKVIHVIFLRIIYFSSSGGDQ